jgi:hypothetical protein
MSDRTIALHVFCSVKGGVGKSTLATVLAKQLAEQKRVPVLVDCDLTGTSLADGLRLRAPRVPVRADGTLDLGAAPTGEHHDLDETRRLRRRRRDAVTGDRITAPVYFNDILGHPSEEDERGLRADAALWRHEKDDGVAYLPSSSIQRDVVKSLDWFNSPVGFDWARRALWTFHNLATHRSDLTDIVVDLPPGTWGFSHQMLVVAATLHAQKPLPPGYPPWDAGAIRCQARAFLVTSQDNNDLLPALEFVAAHQRQLPTLAPLANRVTLSPNALRENVRSLLGPAASASGLEERLTKVDHDRKLAEIFQVGDVSFDDDVRAHTQALWARKGA